MFKKTDSSNFTIADSNGYNLHYTPSEVIKNAKIYRGIITISTSSFATSTTFNVKVDNEIIDRVNIDSSKSYICLDITDELQDLLSKENGETLSIVFEGNNLINVNDIKCYIEYDPQTINNSGNLVKNINVNRAGSGSISLFNKNFYFSHEDVKTNSKVLPINIKHAYSKFNKDNSFVLLRNGSQFELPKSFCGKGWRLNYQQFLVKENHSELFDNETSNTYTYIDDIGNQIVFQEKFYYYSKEDKNKEHKIYALASNVEIGQDGALTYTTNSGVVEVFTEITSNSDYVLETKKERFKGIEYIQQDIEDIANLKSQIKDLQISLEDCENNKVYNSQQNDILDKFNLMSKIQEKLQQISNFSNNESIKLSVNNKSDQENYNEYYKNYRDITDSSLSQGKDDKIKANNYQDNLDINNNNFQWQGYLKNDNVNAINALESEMNENLSLESIESKVYTYSFKTMGAIYRNKLSAVLSNYLIIVNNAYNESTKTLQTEQLKNELTKLEKLINNYKIRLSQYLYQLRELEKQIPEYYLTDKQGKSFMGFAKFKEDSLFSTNKNVEKNDDIYRLVAIADSYDNTIVINYDDTKDECKISSIVDTDNNAVMFNYNDYGLLDNIVDDRENKISFDYNENELLTSIQYMDNTKSIYEYNSNGLLSKIVDNSGYGVQLTYSYNDINVEELATYSLIRDKQKPIACKSGNTYTPRVRQLFNVRYYDYRTTIFTDEKGNVETYLFDSYGNPTTVYSGFFDENTTETKNTSSVNYQFKNNKITEKSYKLKNSKNILRVYSENYLGDELYLGDEIYPTLYELPKDNEIHNINEGVNNIYEIPINKSQLQLLNCGTRCYILSAWAKADSAFVLSADEKNQNDLDEIINNNLTKYRKNRKFELRAVLSIKPTNAETTEQENDKSPINKSFSRSFDWMQTNWQYCELPIVLEENETVVDGHLYFDYTNNTNSAQMFGFSLNEGVFERSEYNEDNLLVKQNNYLQNTEVNVEYDKDNLPIKQTLTYKNKDYITTYAYNKNKDIIRIVDYNGMVEERKYNDKGQIIKTSKYNLSDPSSKYISKTKLNDKGQETGSIDEFGDDDCEYEYLGNTGIVSSVKDRHGHKTSYGYNPMTEELVSMSASASDEENSNIYGYTLGFLTSLSHNDFAYKFEYDGFGRQTAIRIDGQDNAYVKSQYLENSVLNTYSSGEVFETIKDTNGNVSNVKYTGKDSDDLPTNLLVNTYDDNNNLIKQEECIETKSDEQTSVQKNIYENKYDSHGNVTYSSKSKVLDDNSTQKEIEISSSYNAFENVERSTIKIENTDTLTYKYKYDNSPDNRLQSLTLPNGSKQTLEYDPLNRVKDIYYDDKFSKHINYVKKGEYCSDLISSVWYGKDGIIKDNTKYTYDEKGNITKIYENGTEKVKYTYDELSRLVREDNRELNKTFIYSYDSGGNIVEKFETVYTLNSTENIVKETVTESDIAYDKKEYGFSLRKLSKLTKYGYPATGWKDQLLSVDDKSFVYDSLGNPTTYKDTTLKWNYLRNLEKFGDIATYTYNASGIRTHKKVGNAETQFYLNGNKIISQITKQQIINGKDVNEKIDKLIFYYGIDGLTGFNHNGIEYIYKKNIQNDIIGIYDNNGQEIVQYTYDAWGNCITKYLQDDKTYATIDSGYNGTDTSITNRFIAFINPFRYRSYYYDFETNLYYLNSRYYDPQIGRFINADDISILSEGKDFFNGLNLYAYCGNNPVIYYDPNGKFLIAIILGFLAVTTVAGAILGGVTAYQNGARGWDLVKGIVLGGALGLAAGGAIIATGAVVFGAIFGISATFLGVTALQAFAIGALAFNFTALIIAPLFGLEMQSIEFEIPSKDTNYYQTPSYTYNFLPFLQGNMFGLIIHNLNKKGVKSDAGFFRRFIPKL